MWISVEWLVFYSIIHLFHGIYAYIVIHELMLNQGLLTIALNNNNKSINCSIAA